MSYFEYPPKHGGKDGGVLSVGPINGQAPSVDGATIVGTTLYMQTSSATTVGELSAADWVTFNNKANGPGDAILNGGNTLGQLTIGALDNAEVDFISNGNIGMSLIPNNNGSLSIPNSILYARTVDNTTTGTGATLNSSLTPYIILTNASLVSISQIIAVVNGQILILTNATGASILINDESGATANRRIRTGIAGPYTLNNNASVQFIYDGTNNRWRLEGAQASTALTIGSIDGQTPSANGAVISSNSLFMQSASATVPGLVNLTTQSFAGNKTFTGTISASNLSGTNTGDVTLTAVGASPSANGASLSGQALTLQPADTTHPGVLTAADWNIFNGKANEVIPTINQMVYANSNTGDDSTGTGSYDKPYKTVAHAMTTITDASTTKPYVVAIQAARQIETTDIFMKPYTFICGILQRASYIRINGGGALKPDPSHATLNSWVGLGNLYWGGSSPINWDLQALGGANCVFINQNCTITGAFTYKGRNSGGGDYLENYTGIMFGPLVWDSINPQTQSVEIIGTTTLTNTQAISMNVSFDNVVFDGNVAFTDSGTMGLNNCSYGSGVTLTTTGTMTLNSYRGLPNKSVRTFSGGTTVTNIDNATIVSYAPTTTANWNTIPTDASGGLDTLAISGVAKTQTANTILSGPTSGGAALPTFRALVSADIPSLPYASSALTNTHIFVGNASNIATDVAASGDLTLANTGAFTIANNVVSNAKLRQSAGLSVIGTTGSSTANVADITGTANQVLRVDSGATALAFGAINIASSSAVTGTLAVANGGTGQASALVQGGVIYGASTTAMASSAVGSSGQYLKSNGTAAPAFVSFTIPTIQTFTSSSGTYTKPAGVLYLKVTMIGGGGGGGGNSQNASAGADGTASTFGSSLLTAGLGGGGSAPASATGGTAGTNVINSPAITMIDAPGAVGQGGSFTGTTAQLPGANGASSTLGGGGGGGNNGGAGANGGLGAGGGGGGQSAALSVPGAGGGSAGYLQAMITTPSSTYAYSVGAGGTGAPGSGNGGSGLILVEEFYQ